MEMAETFTADIVTRAIKSCRNSKAFGPDKLSIFHLKNLGPRAIEYITALFNLSVTNCQIPAIWKSSLIIPISTPGKDTSQGSSYRPISRLCPAAKVLESLILHTINKYLQPAPAPLRGREAKTCFRGVKSSSRKVHAGVPQGSKLPPSLFSFYIADANRTSQTGLLC